MYKSGKEHTEQYHIGKPIQIVYTYGKLVWEAIRSCFGKGFWINEQPWRNEDGWKNE